MPESPSVTIITLTRNRAPLLKRAIKSVLSQSFTDYEYIIVDGASDDNTEEIVMSFCDKRITYIKQLINKSTRESMEDAIKIANGKYITFLDDDDEYLSTKIEKQVELFDTLTDNYGLIYCWMDYYDYETGKVVIHHHPICRGYCFYNLIEKQSIGGTPTLMIRKSIYTQYGGWNKNLDYISDWELVTRISRDYLIDYVPEVLVKVNVNHQYVRQSKEQDKLKRESIFNLILFHKHFMLEFKEGFIKYPEKKIAHLYRLVKLYSYLGNRKEVIIIIKNLFSEFGCRLIFIKLIIFFFLISLSKYNENH